MPDWQLEMGARVLDNGRVRFRVYAPRARTVELETYPWPGSDIDSHPMALEGEGVWGAELDMRVGALYRYRLDETWGYANPYSRSQPEGVHGPSQIVDSAFEWTDPGWRGLDRDALVIYELHIGTYTPDGTFDAVIPHLDALRELGITAIELMPVCEFPGSRNWGYDAAHRFAPETSYGGVAGLQRLVDAAHARGLGVILDVVYNHLGPDGDYLHVFVPEALTDRYQTPWGKAINFDGEGGAFMRRYVMDNVLFWMHEFHIDGFRLDAAHEIYDSSQPHILRELAQVVHEMAPAGKRCIIVAEHERHEARVITSPNTGGYGLDAMWVDDFHHSTYVRLTGEHEGYLGAYQGTMAEIARLINDGMLYCDTVGVPRPDSGERTPRQSLVYCLQNHDQIGNRHFGTRLTEIAGLEHYKAAYALLLLLEETPLLFMGDEYAASTPFLYFTEHTPELAALAATGREAAFRVFWAARAGDDLKAPDAQAESTFAASKLDWNEVERAPHHRVNLLFRELLQLRREDAVLRSPIPRSRAEATGDDVLVIGRGEKGERRLIVVNFGDSAEFERGDTWQPILSTAEERFAGPGVELAAMRLAGAAVQLPARSTTVWRIESEP